MVLDRFDLVDEYANEVIMQIRYMLQLRDMFQCVLHVRKPLYRHLNHHVTRFITSYMIRPRFDLINMQMRSLCKLLKFYKLSSRFEFSMSKTIGSNQNTLHSPTFLGHLFWQVNYTCRYQLCDVTQRKPPPRQIQICISRLLYICAYKNNDISVSTGSIFMKKRPASLKKYGLQRGTLG